MPPTELAPNPEAAFKNFVKGFAEAVSNAEPDPQPKENEDVSPPGPTSNRNAPVESAPKTAEAPKETPKAATPADETNKVAQQPDGEAEKWPRSAQEWKRFRELRKQREDELTAKLTAAEAKAKELESKVSTATSTTDLTPEVEKWRKEAETYSDKLRLLEVTQHPKFQAYFDGKTKQQIELAKRIVGSEKAEQITSLLAMPDSTWKQQQIEEHLLDLTPLQQSRLGSVMNSLAEIENEKASEIEKARTNHESMVREQEAARTKSQQAFEKMFNDAVNARAKEHAAFQKRDGDDAYNSAVEKRINSAKALLFPNGEIKPDAYINAVLDAAAYRPVLEQTLALQKQVETLEEQIKSLKASTPTLESASAPSGGTAQRSIATNPQDAIRDFARRVAADLNG